MDVGIFMMKKHIFFALLCLFIIKCMIYSPNFADAAIVAVLISYRLLNKVVEIKKIEKTNELAEEKFNKLHEDLVNLKNTVDSLKVKEQLVNSLGFGTKK
jgi:peptidoglycan hydrolase CwlO-like protein